MFLPVREVLVFLFVFWWSTEYRKINPFFFFFNSLYLYSCSINNCYAGKHKATKMSNQNVDEILVLYLREFDDGSLFVIVVILVYFFYLKKTIACFTLPTLAIGNTLILESEEVTDNGPIDFDLSFLWNISTGVLRRSCWQAGRGIY